MIIRLLNVLVGAGKFGKYAQISATWGENVHMSLFLLHVLKKMIKPAKIRENVINIEKSQHFSENTYFFIANPRRKANLLIEFVRIEKQRKDKRPTKERNTTFSPISPKTLTVMYVADANHRDNIALPKSHAKEMIYQNLKNLETPLQQITKFSTMRINPEKLTETYASSKTERLNLFAPIQQHPNQLQRLAWHWKDF